jgi:hypothetical protein
MDGTPTSRFFLEPEQTFHRRYEALRAVFVDGEPLDRVAERFGYKLSALRSMISRFRADCRRGVTPPFFFGTGAGDPPGGPAPRGESPSNPPRSPIAAS